MSRASVQGPDRVGEALEKICDCLIVDDQWRRDAQDVFARILGRDTALEQSLGDRSLEELIAVE